MRRLQTSLFPGWRSEVIISRPPAPQREVAAPMWQAANKLVSGGHPLRITMSKSGDASVIEALLWTWFRCKFTS